ncbi:hypothetical protein E8E11_006448 [Didymella keratinophila]|nr:hypothetical protein E8E11_006448 [Didymella keratinophila]
MGKIYSHASSVLARLGPSEDVTHFFAYINSFTPSSSGSKSTKNSLYNTQSRQNLTTVEDLKPLRVQVKRWSSAEVMDGTAWKAELLQTGVADDNDHMLEAYAQAMVGGTDIKTKNFKHGFPRTLVQLLLFLPHRVTAFSRI